MAVSIALLAGMPRLVLADAVPFSVPPRPAADVERGAFALRSASVRAVDGVYLLDAVAHLRLTAAVRRALDSGVNLTVTWRVEIERGRAWWLDADVAGLVQRYRLEYHELTLQYVVTNLNTGERRSFVDLDVALDHVGTLIGFPLIDRMLIGEPDRHTGHVRVYLDHSELPLPLRPIALFSSDWDLASEWHAWPFD